MSTLSSTLESLTLALEETSAIALALLSINGISPSVYRDLLVKLLAVNLSSLEACLNWEPLVVGVELSPSVQSSRFVNVVNEVNRCARIPSVIIVLLISSAAEATPDSELIQRFG